jgi:3',5'-cyclic-nucleotide phosphodiesterase/cAMP-specific phosphodiesterase 4
MDVTNSSVFFLDCGIKEILSDFEVACLIISSLAHDIGHPGLNNSYMVNSKSKQALLCMLSAYTINRQRSERS